MTTLLGSFNNAGLALDNCIVGSCVALCNADRCFRLARGFFQLKRGGKCNRLAAAEEKAKSLPPVLGETNSVLFASSIHHRQVG